MALVVNLVADFWALVTTVQNLGAMSCPVMLDHKSINFFCYIPVLSTDWVTDKIFVGV